MSIILVEEVCLNWRIDRRLFAAVKFREFNNIRSRYMLCSPYFLMCLKFEGKPRKTRLSVEVRTSIQLKLSRYEFCSSGNCLCLETKGELIAFVVAVIDDTAACRWHTLFCYLVVIHMSEVIVST